MPKYNSPLKPPSNIKPDPPKEIQKDTIFDSSAPLLKNLNKNDERSLDRYLYTADIKTIDQRLTLLSRLILEQSLWQSPSKDTLSFKERADLALNTIRLLEGTKQNLWIKEEDENEPRTKDELRKEMEEVEKRLIELVGSDKNLKKKAELALKANSLVEENKNGQNIKVP